MLHRLSTHQWHNIPVSARSGSPPQCVTFSSTVLGCEECIRNNIILITSLSSKWEWMLNCTCIDRLRQHAHCSVCRSEHETTALMHLHFALKFKGISSHTLQVHSLTMTIHFKTWRRIARIKRNYMYPVYKVSTGHFSFGTTLAIASRYML